MSRSALICEAARNNAEWCDAFCRTHGIAGRFSAGFWSSPRRTPPLYPDAVTLVPGADVDRMIAAIDVGQGCSIKDSFADLDLAPYGFRPLFRAEWLRKPPDWTPAASPGTWIALSTEQQLREWESAWGESPDAARSFRTALLGEEAIAVLATYEAGRIVGGAIANRSAKVIGLSNLFDTSGDPESVWLGASAAANATLGQSPVVSYDSGASIEAAHRVGFETIGELSVWLATSSPP